MKKICLLTVTVLLLTAPMTQAGLTSWLRDWFSVPTTNAPTVLATNRPPRWQLKAPGGSVGIRADATLPAPCACVLAGLAGIVGGCGIGFVTATLHDRRRWKDWTGARVSDPQRGASSKHCDS